MRRVTGKGTRNDGEENERLDVALPPDVMANILSKLPARSFAASACTCRSWNRLCSRVLSRPKLLSALSLRTTAEDAVDEACNAVLSEPIRPHFVISYMGKKFYLEEVLRLLKMKLSSSIPMIVCYSPGIIGRNARTKGLDEVFWGHEESHSESFGSSSESHEGFGLVLTIGFVPGLKVAVMPVRRVNQDCDTESLIDMYLTSIKTYVESVSGSSSPAGVIMFADEGRDAGCGATYFLEKMDEFLRDQNHKIPVAGCLLRGHRGVQFLSDGCEYLTLGSQCYKVKSSQSSRTQAKHVGTHSQESVLFDVVGLVFAEDKDKSCGEWEIQFNVAISHGLSPVGPTFMTASVRHIVNGTSGSSTWITARKEGSLNLDGNSLLRDLEKEVGTEKAEKAFYIVVEKKRKHAVSSRKWKIVTSFSLHEITDADEEYLYVRGSGIRTGDPIRFCAADVETGFASRTTMLEKFMHLKGAIAGDQQDKQGGGNDGLQVFGGLIFACVGHGEPFFHRLGVDLCHRAMLLEVFPDASLAGTFCLGEIGPSLMETVEENPSTCVLNRFSTVFLVMTCKPKHGSQVKEN